MVFVWGGSWSWSELAQRFGWHSVILSVLAQPFWFVFHHIVGFPCFLRPCNGCLISRVHYDYPGQKDMGKKRFYQAEVGSTSKFQCLPAGFRVHVDLEGGKWFESFWGFIQKFDLQQVHDDRWLLTTNWTSIFPARICIDFQPDGFGHDVTFILPYKGVFMFWPPAILMVMFTFSAIGWGMGVQTPATFKKWAQEAKAPDVVIDFTAPIPPEGYTLLDEYARPMSIV